MQGVDRNRKLHLPPAKRSAPQTPRPPPPPGPPCNSAALLLKCRCKRQRYCTNACCTGTQETIEEWLKPCQLCLCQLQQSKQNKQKQKQNKKRDKKGKEKKNEKKRIRFSGRYFIMAAVSHRVIEPSQPLQRCFCHS